MHESRQALRKYLSEAWLFTGNDFRRNENQFRMQTSTDWDLLWEGCFFVIKKDNHLFFLILTTAPMFIKHKSQEQF